MKAVARVVLMVCLIVGAPALSIPVAVAQQSTHAGPIIDPALFEQGRVLYDANCVACHQAGGAGTPPSFPALTGNDRLKDLNLIVRAIRLGQGAMLAFPKLTDGEIAALATYIRNAWGNKLGAVTADQVATILAGLSKPADKKVSVWSGVYTQAQNKRGEELHSGACAQCHGLRLNGAAQPDMPPSPAIARATFVRKWEGQTVAALFTYVRTKMPPDNPGTITDQQSIDAIAHMFAVSNMPAGDKELPPDPNALEGIVINAKPK
ncbi:MAG: c-type cytochrome [Rhizobiales bacterium]|nr:c-type cytochrome [Hyphomicrobiales bacterium]